MTNLQTLIEQTLTLAVEAFNNGNTSLSETYFEDRKEFMNIQYLLKAGYTKAASKAINEMDTLPREQIIEALINDQAI